MSRLLIVSAFLVLFLPQVPPLPASGHGQSTGGRATQAAGSASKGALQFLDVNDPVYGLEIGKLAFFSGWQGTASVTRNDAFCPDCNTVSVAMSSPDGRSQIQTYDEGLHTGLYPPLGQKGHYLKTRFTSTGDLLVQGILPGLNLPGQTSQPRPSLSRQGEAALEEVKRYPIVSMPFAQGAAVTITGTGSGKDYVVEALTIGGAVGTPTEFTVTHFTLIQAPTGEAEALAKRWEALPTMTINPEWRRLNDDHVVAALRRMQQQGQQQSAQVQQFMRDYNAKQAAFNSSQLVSNQAARDAQQRRANQSQLDAQQNQRNITDTGNQVIDSRNGNSRYYTFCNNLTGQVVYQYNTTAPPDSTGRWLRCGN